MKRLLMVGALLALSSVYIYSDSPGCATEGKECKRSGEPCKSSPRLCCKTTEQNSLCRIVSSDSCPAEFGNLIKQEAKEQ